MLRCLLRSAMVRKFWMGLGVLGGDLRIFHVSLRAIKGSGNLPGTFSCRFDFRVLWPPVAQSPPVIGRTALADSRRLCVFRVEAFAVSNARGLGVASASLFRRQSRALWRPKLVRRYAIPTASRRPAR